MDKIWDGQMSKSGVYRQLWQGLKNEWPRRTDKSQMLTKII